MTRTYNTHENLCLFLQFCERYLFLIGTACFPERGSLVRAHVTIKVYLFLAKMVSEWRDSHNRRKIRPLSFRMILVVYLGHGGFFIRDKAGLFVLQSCFSGEVLTS